jgi:hypothetical protein
MLHFVQPTFLYIPAVPQPLFTRSQSTQSRTVQRPTATAQHCCTSAPVHLIPVHTITNDTTVHSHSTAVPQPLFTRSQSTQSRTARSPSTALLYLSPCSTDPSPHNYEWYNSPKPQHSTAVPQPLFTRSQSTQSRTVQRPKATGQHCCPAMYCNVTFQLTAVY